MFKLIRRHECAAEHEWQYHEYYCGYADGYSQRAFPCDSCGDKPTCGGQMVKRICSICGAKEWIYPGDVRM